MSKKKKLKEPEQKEPPKDQSELKEETSGFPQDVDFKKFLGCGG